MKGHNYGNCKTCGKFHKHPRGMLGKTNKGVNLGKIPWNKGLTSKTDIRIKKYAKKLKGRKITWGDKISITKTGKTVPKLSEKLRGRKQPKKLNIKRSKTLKRHQKDFLEEHKQTLFSELKNLEKQGYKCIPIVKPLPDIIAIKDNKVFAIEVEFGKIEPKRYDGVTYFDDIIWIKETRKGKKK